MSSPTSSPQRFDSYTNPTVQASAYAEPETYAPAPTPAPVSSGATAYGLDMLVTPAQRERAEAFLQEAYADGRLTHADFEVRLDQVLGASTRRDLNQAFYGLVAVPPTSAALGLHPAYRPSLVNQGQTGRTGKAMASLSHFSVFFLWIFGPLMMYLIGGKGTYAKREAAKAFNFQLYSFGGLVGLGVLDAVGPGDMGWAVALGGVAWFVLTLIGGVRASQGEDWTNPVNRLMPWKPLDERG
ncbi:DUF1707 domain-containing protein [Mariniluteicoccus endophyticus]